MTIIFYTVVVVWGLLGGFSWYAVVKRNVWEIGDKLTAYDIYMLFTGILLGPIGMTIMREDVWGLIRGKK